MLLELGRIDGCQRGIVVGEQAVGQHGELQLGDTLVSAQCTLLLLSALKQLILLDHQLGELIIERSA